MGMTRRTLYCPQCTAPVELTDDRTYIRCEYCGARFVVDHTNSSAPALETYDAAVRRMRPSALPIVKGRASELAGTIAESEHVIALDREKLAAARRDYASAKAAAQQAIVGPQNLTFALGLLAALSWLLVLFVLKGVSWNAGLASAIVFLVAARVARHRWETAEREAWRGLQAAKVAIAQLRDHLQGTAQRLQDHHLEHELYQRTLELHRSDLKQGPQ